MGVRSAPFLETPPHHTVVQLYRHSQRVIRIFDSSLPLQVEYKDFPKNNKNEYVSLINCSSQPPLISHGIGKDVESCHDTVSNSTAWASLRLSQVRLCKMTNI